MATQAATDSIMEPVLEVRDLRTYFYDDEGRAIPAVDGVSFTLERGKTLAIVGESGCGKSVTSLSLLQLIQKPGRIEGGEILLHRSETETVNVTRLTEKDDELYRVRGGDIALIFQEPMTALSPVHTIGNQLCEAILLHQEMTEEQAQARAIEMLGKVGIPRPETRLNQYPHELSGGMRQRVVIAMALVCEPSVLIADEPTTALDVTIQAQILRLINDLKRETGSSVIFITHDLGVVAQIADEVAVMYLGRVVERAPVEQLFAAPQHPYTMGLLQSLPGLKSRGARLPAIKGTVPSLTNIPAGCPFHPRCEYAQAGRCDAGERPPLFEAANRHQAACVRLDAIHSDNGESGDRKP